MEYIISFLEGIITFISPCLLPMIPVYLTYFAGGGQRSAAKTLKGAFGFVAGFTVVFVAMGALAGTLGGFLVEYQKTVNIVSGLIVVFFGLSFMGIIRVNIFGGSKGLKTAGGGFVQSLLFGIVFSVGWTPCVGAFLGSALVMASQQGHMLKGMLMLLCYSLGLGIPFIISAVLIDQLKSAFDFIKRNYEVINKICGVLLVAVGVMMMTGTMGRLLSVLG